MAKEEISNPFPSVKVIITFYLFKNFGGNKMTKKDIFWPKNSSNGHRQATWKVEHSKNWQYFFNFLPLL